MNTVWVIVKDGEVYGVAEDRITAYHILKKYVIENYNGVPKAIAKNLLTKTFSSFDTKLSIGNGIYAEEWGISD